MLCLILRKLHCSNLFLSYQLRKLLDILYWYICWMDQLVITLSHYHYQLIDYDRNCVFEFSQMRSFHSMCSAAFFSCNFLFEALGTEDENGLLPSNSTKKQTNKFVFVLATCQEILRFFWKKCLKFCVVSRLQNVFQKFCIFAFCCNSLWWHFSFLRFSFGRHFGFA